MQAWAIHDLRRQMATEKEILVDFTFAVIRELGLNLHAWKLDRKEWLTMPIPGIRQAASDMTALAMNLMPDPGQELTWPELRKACPRLAG